MARLPEVFVRSNLTWDEQAWLGIRKTGCVILRDIFDRSFIEACGLCSDQVFRYFNGEGKETLSELDLKVLEQKAFQIRHLVIDQVSAAETLSKALLPFASMTLGRPAALGRLSFVRRVDPGDTEDGYGHKLPFHQDQKILKASLVNAWIPFNDAGVEAPGLEVVAKRLTDTEPTITHTNHVYGEVGVEISADHVYRNFNNDLVAPTINVGDALVFYGTTIHRTFISPTMTQSRTSVDMRFLTKA